MGRLRGLPWERRAARCLRPSAGGGWGRGGHQTQRAPFPPVRPLLALTRGGVVDSTFDTGRRRRSAGAVGKRAKTEIEMGRGGRENATGRQSRSDGQARGGDEMIRTGRMKKKKTTKTTCRQAGRKTKKRHGGDEGRGTLRGRRRGHVGAPPKRAEKGAEGKRTRGERMGWRARESRPLVWTAGARRRNHEQPRGSRALGEGAQAEAQAEARGGGGD